MADKFTQLLPLLGALVAFLLAALLLVYIFRLVFGKRIRAPGPRNRPRRLDVVDVFDLDKERQLVIVRRDNTEHLLLIGGPNDVLVEGAINRLDLTATRSAPTTASVNWPAAPSSADEELEAEVRPSATGLKPAGPLNLPPDLFAQKSPALSSSTTAPIVSAPSSSSPLAAPPPPLSPNAPRPSLSLSTPPARPAPPPRPPGMPSFLSRTQRIITPKKETEEGVSAPATAPEPPRPSPPIFAPAPPRSAPPPLPETPKAPPPPPPPPPSAGLMPSAQRPVMPTVKESAEAPKSDPLDSLEEEMARLLGRTDKE